MQNLKHFQLKRINNQKKEIKQQKQEQENQPLN